MYYISLATQDKSLLLNCKYLLVARFRIYIDKKLELNAPWFFLCSILDDRLIELNDLTSL